MRFRLSLALSALMAAALVQAQMSSFSTVPATGGDIQITALGHASVQLEQGGKVILVDPVGMMADLSKAKQADLILVTDIHGDHLDPAAIAKLRKQGAPVVIPAAASDKVPGGVVMANRAIRTVAGVPITAIPAAPASIIAATRVIITPPIATTGIDTAITTSESPPRPAAGTPAWLSVS